MTSPSFLTEAAVKAIIIFKYGTESVGMIMKKTALLLAFIMILASFSACSTPSENGDGTKDVTEVHGLQDKETAADKDSEGASQGDGKEKEETVSPQGGDEQEAPSAQTAPLPGIDTEKDESDGSRADSSADSGDKEDKGDKEDEKDETEGEDRENGDENGSGQYTDGIVLEAYLDLLVPYFTSPCKGTAEVVKQDVFHASARFIYTQQKGKVVECESDSSLYGIKGEDLQSVAALLFGSAADRDVLDSFIDKKAGDSYDGGTDTYYFLKSKYNYADSGYYLSYGDKMEIEELDDKIIATLTLAGDSKSKKTLTYTFEKAVEEGYLYLRLVKVAK